VDEASKAPDASMLTASWAEAVVHLQMLLRSISERSVLPSDSENRGSHCWGTTRTVSSVPQRWMHCRRWRHAAGERLFVAFRGGAWRVRGICVAHRSSRDPLRRSTEYRCLMVSERWILASAARWCEEGTCSESASRMYCSQMDAWNARFGKLIGFMNATKTRQYEKCNWLRIFRWFRERVRVEYILFMLEFGMQTAAVGAYPERPPRESIWSSSLTGCTYDQRWGPSDSSVWLLSSMRC